MRRTTTSNEVKDRWNSKHYDSVQFRVYKGAREIISTLAEQEGKSLAEYLRGLIIADAKAKGQDIASRLGGGGR